MNKVLSQMIPGLTIDVHDFGKQVFKMETLDVEFN